MECISQRRSTGGYNLLETLLAMAVIAFLVLLCCPMIKTVELLNTETVYDYQSATAIYQLQLRLSFYEILEVNSDEIILQGEDGEMTLSLVNDNLIIQPGYNCFIHNVDTVLFYQLADVVFMKYEQNEEENTVAIAYR